MTSQIRMWEWRKKPSTLIKRFWLTHMKEEARLLFMRHGPEPGILLILG